MKFSKLEELNVWTESVKLAVEVYKIIQSNTKLNRDYGLKDQLQRSVVSVSSNIAEGFERETNSEFIRSLFIAKGSCAELKTQLLIAKEIGFLKEARYNELIQDCHRISIMIYKLIEYLKKKRSSSQ